MEVETVAAEIIYSLKIPNLSNYNPGDELYMEFPLTLGGLRSQWGVKIHPFLSSKPNKPHHINSDIGITLLCLRSSITNPGIDIYCRVVGRGEEHESKLEILEDESTTTSTWYGVLVPRVALHVYELLPQDLLTATLRFAIRADDVWRNVDPLEELSTQVGKLREGKKGDVTILTSDGVTLPAHSAILHARSSLLRKSSLDIPEKISILKTNDHLQVIDSGLETPLNTFFGSDMSSSGYRSNSSLSSNSTGKSVNVSSPGRAMLSLRTDRLTPVRSGTHVTSPAKSVHVSSPGRAVSSHRTDSRTPVRSGTRVTSPARHPHMSSHLTGCYKGERSTSTAGDKKPYSPSKFSPSKRSSASVTPSSPCRRIMHGGNQALRPRRPSPLPPVSCDSVNSSTSSSPFSKSPLKELKGNIQRLPVEGHTLKVNMSASVAESLLDWIYTGECSNLKHLAKPLLVAGKRHGVDGLVLACEQHLAATLTPATAPHILLLAHKYSADSLCSATMKYAVTQAKEVTSQPSWATVGTCAPALMTEFSRLLALHAHPGRRR